MQHRDLAFFYRLIAVILVLYGTSAAAVDGEDFPADDDVIDEVTTFTPPEFCLVDPPTDDATCAGGSRDMWYYSSAGNRCLTFEHRGCVEIRNSFRTERDCYSICTGAKYSSDRSPRFNKDSGRNFMRDDEISASELDDEDSERTQVQASTIPPLVNEVSSKPVTQYNNPKKDSKNFEKSQETGNSRENEQRETNADERIPTKDQTGFDEVKRIIGKEIADIKEFVLHGSKVPSSTFQPATDSVESSTTIIPLMKAQESLSTQKDLLREYIKDNELNEESKISTKSTDDHSQSYLKTFSTQGFANDEKKTTQFGTPGITEFSTGTRYPGPPTATPQHDMPAETSKISNAKEQFLSVKQVNTEAEDVKGTENPRDAFKSEFYLNVEKQLHHMEDKDQKVHQPEMISVDQNGFEIDLSTEDNLRNGITFKKLSDKQGQKGIISSTKKLEGNEQLIPSFGFKEKSHRLNRIMTSEAFERFDDDNDFLYEVLPDDNIETSQEEAIKSINLRQRKLNSKPRDRLDQSSESSYINPTNENDENRNGNGRKDIKQGSQESFVAKEGNDDQFAGFPNQKAAFGTFDEGSDKTESSNKSTTLDLNKEELVQKQDQGRSIEAPTDSISGFTTTVDTIIPMTEDRSTLTHDEGNDFNSATNDKSKNAKPNNTTNGFIKIIRGNLRFFRPPPIQFRPLEDPTWSILNELAAPLFPLLPISEMAVDKNAKKQSPGFPHFDGRKTESKEEPGRMTEGSIPAINERKYSKIFKLNPRHNYWEENPLPVPFRPRSNPLWGDGSMKQRIVMVPPAILITPNRSQMNRDMANSQKKDKMNEFNGKGHRNIETEDDQNKISSTNAPIPAKDFSPKENMELKSNQFAFWTPLRMLIENKIRNEPHTPIASLQNSEIRKSFGGTPKDGRNQENFGMNGRRMYSLHLTAKYHPDSFIGMSRMVSMHPISQDFNGNSFENGMFENPQNQFHNFPDDHYQNQHSRPWLSPNSHHLPSNSFNNNHKQFPTRKGSQQQRYVPRNSPFAPTDDGLAIEENYQQFNFIDSNPMEEMVNQRIHPQIDNGGDFLQPPTGEFRAQNPYPRNNNPIHLDSDISRQRGSPIKQVPNLNSRDFPENEDRQFAEVEKEHDGNEEYDQIVNSASASSGQFSFETEPEWSESHGTRKSGMKPDSKPSRFHPSSLRIVNRNKPRRPVNLDISPQNKFTLMQIFVNRNEEPPNYPIPPPALPPIRENPSLNGEKLGYPQIPLYHRQDSVMGPWHKNTGRGGEVQRTESEVRNADEPELDESKNNGQRLMPEISEELPQPHHSACYQPLHLGDCKSVEIRWYYNSYLGRCEMFQYGGCGGNDNRFTSYENCLQLCIAEKHDEEELMPSTTNIPVTIKPSDMKELVEKSVEITEAVTSSTSTAVAGVLSKVDIPQDESKDDSVKKTKLEPSIENKGDDTKEGVLSTQYIIIAAVIGVVALLVLTLGACGLAHVCRKRRNNKETAVEEVAKAYVYGVTNIMYPESEVSDDKDSGSVKISNKETPEV